MENIVSEIEQLSNEMDGLFTAFKESEVKYDDLELAHKRVTNLFAEIRTYGVCRDDIDKINAMGFAEIESMYYTESRSMVGLQAALEVEGNTDWMQIVIGGLIAALVAVLAFFVGKFLGYLFGAIEKGSSATSSAKSSSKVKSIEAVPTIELKGDKVSDLCGLIHVGRKSKEVLNGEAVVLIVEACETALPEIEDALVKVKTEAGLNELLGKDGVNALKSVINNKTREGVSKDVKSKIIASVAHNTETTNKLITTVAPTLKLINPELVATGNEFIGNTSIRLYRLKPEELFPEALVKNRKVPIAPEIIDLNSGDLESRAKKLEKEAVKLKETVNRLPKQKSMASEYLELVEGKGNVRQKASRDFDQIIKIVMTYHVVYPAQTVYGLVKNVALPILTAIAKYNKRAIMYQLAVYKIFSEANLAKMKDSMQKIVDSKDVDTAIKAGVKGIIDDLNDINNVSDVEAFDILMRTVNSSKSLQTNKLPIYPVLFAGSELKVVRELCKGNDKMTLETFAQAIMDEKSK